MINFKIKILKLRMKNFNFDENIELCNKQEMMLKREF